MTRASSSTVWTPCSPRWSAGDVGDHAHIVALVAKPAQQDAAAGRFEDRDVESRFLEDPGRAGRTGVVAVEDHLPLDEDAGGRSPANPSPAVHQDRGDEAGGRRLAVGACDGDDRDIGVPRRAASRAGRRRRRVSRRAGAISARRSSRPSMLPVTICQAALAICLPRARWYQEKATAGVPGSFHVSGYDLRAV